MSTPSAGDPKPDQYSVSDLFMQAARRLKKEFDYVRETNPHSATKGSEAEKVLREFLNKHLPQRFRATTGILIDNTNALSKQTDVIIYDALSSPVYRYSEDAMILPVDTVASVIEVKSRLTSDELADSYQKIASVKGLKKRPSSTMDRQATGSDLKLASTLGIILAFTSDITIETVAKKMSELNEKFDSRLWPDMVILLDVGTLNYVLQSPGGEMNGDLMPREEQFPIAPFYINLVLRKDGEFSLNRFFTTLLSHLQFFPHRHSVPPFEVALAGTTKEGVEISTYQYDRDKRLLPLSRSTIELPAAIQIKTAAGKLAATLHWLPWPSGGAVMCEGEAPLEMFLVLAGFAKDEQIFRFGARTYSSVLPVKRSDFLTWPQKLNPRLRGMTAEIVVYKTGHMSDEGTTTPYVARLLAGILELAQRTLSRELSEQFAHSYPIKELLSLRKLFREFEKQDTITEELASALLHASAEVAEKTLGSAKSIGVDVLFLLYREPTYVKRLKSLTDEGLSSYLESHRSAWGTAVAEFVASSVARRSETSKNISRADLRKIYNGVATVSEEIIVYALQQKALAGLRIREIEKGTRDKNFLRRFTTDLTDSWQLSYSPLEFDEL